MSSELSYEASDEASENELLERSLSVWRGWNSIEWDDFAPTLLDIHTACSIGHYEWVRSIILKGGEPSLDRPNHGWWTPLMYACYIGHDDIVNLLINAGCNMNIKNSRGHTPLMLAASCGNESVARTLIRGADLELMDKTGWTALFHATYAGHQNFVAFLLEAGANKNAVEPSSGITPFMEAATEGHEIIAQLFLQHGVDVTARAHNGYMARSLALLNGNIKIVSLIDNHVLPMGYLRSESGLDIYSSSSQDGHPRRQHQSAHNMRLKPQGPSIRDGPDAIARMIDRTHLEVSKGFVSLPVSGIDKEETKMSYRDVTSPINPEDYKDSSGSRATSDLADFNDDSNAFTKTGAITIKSSSSSSGGLIAALGLSRDGSLDSDDSHSCDQTGNSSDDVHEETKVTAENHNRHTREEVSADKLCIADQNIKCENGCLPSPFSGQENITTINNNLRETTEKTTNNLNLRETISPVSDYPLGTHFSRETVALSFSDPKVIDSKSCVIHHEPPTSVNNHLNLPKENMSQVEIVNRFLKNLTMNNPDNSASQNRWAEEPGTDQSTHTDLIRSPVYPLVDDSNTHTPSSAFEAVSTSSRRQASSKIVGGKDRGRNSRNVLHHENSRNRPRFSKKEKYEVSSVQLSGVVIDNNMPGFPISNDRSASIQGDPLLQLNHNPDMNTLQHLPHQFWKHHPRLNHHHPLHSRRNHHNRHNHDPLSHNPDYSGNNTRNNLIPSTAQMPQSCTSDVHQTDSAVPFFHTLPQEYFYRDIEDGGHSHFGPTCEASIHIPSPIFNTPSQQGGHCTELLTPAYPFSHLISPGIDNINHNMQERIESQTSHVQPCQTNQEISHGTDPAFIQQFPAASSPTVLAGTGKHRINLPPSSTVPISHATTQPVCNTIGWDLTVLPERPGPKDLAEMLTQLGLTKYLDMFVEQDVDLQVFLSMTDNDLKELGVRLFGPRKKMTNAIARWHSNAPPARNSREQAYADKLEGEMQEMAIQLNQACGNEERLKAQVLQEQQLRSVTESCLMEERANWEQARQNLLSTKTKMRTMGDITSRLRVYYKELKKHLEEVSKQLTEEALLAGSKQMPSNAHHLSLTTSKSCEIIGDNHSEVDKKIGNSQSNFIKTSSELFKKSEKCLKEMQQTLTSFSVCVDHLLKSTHNVTGVDKDRT